MTVKITPTLLKGEISPPPSKSITHRALICAALSNINDNRPAQAFENKAGLPVSEDIKATKTALKLLNQKEAVVDCAESGSTLRFLIPIFAALGINTEFRGSGELPNRTVAPYLEELPKHGVIFETSAMPYKISGKLKSGEFFISGDVSSQFITGLLTALSLLNGDSEIIITSPLQSKPYVNITISVMEQFGVNVTETERGYSVKGGQVYKPCDFKVEADMSQAAFFVVANSFGANIDITGLNETSLQGDKAILEIVKTSPPYNIDAKDIPDLVPILTVLCALKSGYTSRIYNCERLRLKECDRLLAISAELNKLGAKVKILEDNSLEITGVESLKGGVCSSWNDHRIAMSLAIASIKCEDVLTIERAEAVNKSYPNFFDDFKKLGGVCAVLTD